MKKVCLIIMDGWGTSRRTKGNATAAANLPNLKRYSKEYPCTTIETSGMAVGLPDEQMGNSEVGHLTIGAGRVIYQELTRITRAIETGEFEENPVLNDIIARVIDNGSTLHIMGLLSDGGVHSHINHLYALLDAAGKKGVRDVCVHAFLDGRDTLPSSGLGYVKALSGYMKKNGTGRIATICGRYYAMDRDNRWDRVQKAYEAMTRTTGLSSDDPVSAVKEAYDRGETDEFVMPTMITSLGSGSGAVSDRDAMVFFNFRGDRAREISRAFTEPGFKEFKTRRRPELAGFACMTEYDARMCLPVMFGPQELTNILGEVLSGAGLKQFRVSETEKYAHVTFFFNGGREEPYPGEERLLIPSVKDVPTYDKKPEMRAHEIAQAAVEKIASGEYSFVLMNFANGDMVGHTGVIEAAVKACEAVDAAVGRVVAEALGKGWSVLITSDHGNVEQMLDPKTHEKFTAHSTNGVPFILVDDELCRVKLSRGGGLKDIAPTVLKIMGIEKPEEMDGEALF